MSTANLNSTIDGKTIAILLLGIGFVASTAAVAVAEDRPVAHMVFFTLKEDTPQNRQKLVDGCNKHLSNHEGSVYFSAGTIAEDLDREVNDMTFQVALHLVFANKAAHDKYQTHPRHLQFIDENKQLWIKVRVFDSYLVPVKE